MQPEEKEQTEELLEALQAFRSLRWHPGHNDTQRHCENHVLYFLLKDQESGGIGLRTSDLSSILSVKPPTVTPIINNMESRRLVERLPDASDRRSVRIRLSTVGLNTARKNRERAFLQISRLVQTLGLEQSRSFAKALRITADFLKREQAERDSDHEGGTTENNHD